jgi:acetyltransferase-like isoleucine patch superfamily enzyme
MKVSTMHPKKKTIVKKYHLIEHVYSSAFNISRIIGYIRLPSYDFYFRRLMNHARAGYWSSRFGKIGKGVQIDSGVIVRGNPKNIEIGDYSYIDTNVQLEVYAPIKIGKYVHITPNVYIQSGDEVIIGDFACITNGTKIYASSNTYKTPDGREKDILLSMSSSAPSEMQYIEYGPVIIEEYAFVGLNCVVLPGVRIGRGAIVGAGAVVTKDIPPYTIAVGIPARVVEKRVTPESEAKQ